MALASLIVAIVAILVSAASVLYTRRQALASARQAVAAEDTREIERGRRHDELSPLLSVACVAIQDNIDQPLLRIELVGPEGLDRLDEVTVSIRDDMPDRTPRPGSQLTQEQISETIWGPYKIKAGLQGTDEIGRTHGPFRLPKNEHHVIPLEPAIAPSWTDPGSWRHQYQFKPVRLKITCRREGHEPWILLFEPETERNPARYKW